MTVPAPSFDVPVAGRKLLVLASLAYLLFVIYGSLVPLDFRARPIAEALQDFSRIPYLTLGIGSRADWVANILLFIPLAFLWLGVLWHASSLPMRIGASLLVLGADVALSATLEFTQLFFPARTVSLNDILAESFGSAIGISLWWMAGPKLATWAFRQPTMLTGLNMAQRALYVYLFFLFGYNLLPLDLTLSPVEIYHKWQAGRINLAPFGVVFAHPSEALYNLATDMAIWIPLAFLWRLSSKKPTLSIWLYTVFAAVLLEFLQIFVYTRVSDITDILTAAIGAGIGATLGKLRFDAAPHPSGHSRWFTLWLAAVLGWFLVLAMIFWYPFDFRSDTAFIHERLLSLKKVPFESYYYGTEYRAVTEVFHKIGFFLPLGIILGLALSRITQHHWRRLLNIGVFAFISVTAFVVELGQLFLPGKIIDITDWALETLGGLSGYWLALKWCRRTNVTAPPQKQHASSTRSPLIFVAPSILALTGIGWLAMHSAFVPYNVRELMAPERPLISLLLLSCCLFWTLGVPAWAASRLTRSGSIVLAYPGIILLHGMIGWIFLRLAVPMESIHDIVGSPILNWHWEWELIGRFLALFGALSLALTAGALGAMALGRQHTGPALAYWLINAAVLLPLLYWVIVTRAATDNLTELIAGNGGIGASLLLLLFWMIIGLAGSALALQLSGKLRSMKLATAALLALSLPLAYLAVSYGTEQFVIKYERVFSALQFLLSTDRAHYATHAELLVRYTVLHTAAVGAMALVQWPVFAWLMRTQEKPAYPLKRDRQRRVEPTSD